MGLNTKTYWLTDRQSQCDFDFDFDFDQGSSRGEIREWMPDDPNRSRVVVVVVELVAEASEVEPRGLPVRM
jgi:hypothetical protein